MSLSATNAAVMHASKSSIAAIPIPLMITRLGMPGFGELVRQRRAADPGDGAEEGWTDRCAGTGATGLPGSKAPAKAFVHDSDRYEAPVAALHEEALSGGAGEPILPMSAAALSDSLVTPTLMSRMGSPCAMQGAESLQAWFERNNNVQSKGGEASFVGALPAAAARSQPPCHGTAVTTRAACIPRRPLPI